MADDVSILVLVEVSFRHAQHLREVLRSGSVFNPCFSGSLFPTSGQGTETDVRLGAFSILVLVEVSFRLDPDEQPTGIDTAFQSLF